LKNLPNMALAIAVPALNSDFDALQVKTDVNAENSVNAGGWE
jgi:hypothetical protein